MQATHTIRVSIAFLLTLSVVLLIAPRPTEAQGGVIGGIVECFMPSLKDLVSSIPYVGDFLTGGKKEVPVKEQNLRDKSCYDSIMTGLLKDTIKLMRDMILNWIVTGNLSMPVFSTNYTIDAARFAENASRIFLSKLAGINFCEGFNVGAVQNFAFNFSLSVACSLTNPVQTNYANTMFALAGISDATRPSFDDWLNLRSKENNKIYGYVESEDERQRQIANAVAARNAEHQAGLGFIPIKNTITALATFPGSSAKELADAVGIKSPVNQTDVANTVQQAITAILTTALQQLVNQGYAP